MERDDVKLVKAVTIMIHCTAYNDGNYLRWFRNNENIGNRDPVQ